MRIPQALQFLLAALDLLCREVRQLQYLHERGNGGVGVALVAADGSQFPQAVGACLGSESGHCGCGFVGAARRRGVACAGQAVADAVVGLGCFICAYVIDLDDLGVSGARVVVRLVRGAEVANPEQSVGLLVRPSLSVI